MRLFRTADKTAPLSSSVDGNGREIQTLIDNSRDETPLPDESNDTHHNPLVTELIDLADSIERFIRTVDSRHLATEDCVTFLEMSVLTDIQRALRTCGVEPLVTTRTLNRYCQIVERIEETDDPHRAGKIQVLTRGYAAHDTVLRKQRVVLYQQREEERT